MKQVVFKVDEELYKKSKIKAVQNDQNMTQYLTELMKRDLSEKKEEGEKNE